MMNALISVTPRIVDALALLPLQIPNPAPIQPPGTEGLLVIMGWGKWVALGICILSLFATGALMGFHSRRGEGSEHVSRIGSALSGVTLISAAASLVGFLSGV